MTRSGRPLRFLALVLGGWVTLRIAMLWPDAPLPVARSLASTLGDRERHDAPPSMPSIAAVIAPPPSLPMRRSADHRTPDIGVAALPPPGPAIADRPALPAAPQVGQARVPGPPGLPLATPAPNAASSSRWAASAWLVARRGSGQTTGFGGGQLGGSQAGARLTYLFDRARRIAAALRVSTPLEGRGRELAIGVEWQPVALPVRIIAEQRLSLDGGAGGPTIGVIGGIAPTPIAAGIRLEGYGQAGAIARDGIEGFADGSVRAAHRLGALDRIRFDVGAGLWGAAQRGAARIDIGPSLAADVPIGPVHARLSLDWRARIAGDALPGSGPVFTLGTDF